MRWIQTAFLVAIIVMSGIRPMAAADASFVACAGYDGIPYRDGIGQAARLAPRAVAMAADGSLYVADASNHVIVHVVNSVASVWAGIPGQSGATNGGRTSALFNGPCGLCFDSAGNLYIADQMNHVIRKISTAGMVSTFAGLPGTSGSTDGLGGNARFNQPADVAMDMNGNILVSDMMNQTVRSITGTGTPTVTTLAGAAGVSGSADGALTAARFFKPMGIRVATDGTIFVADEQNCTIRKISSGIVSTLAGSAGVPGAADGTGASARFAYPVGIAWDRSDGVYVSDNNNSTIRHVTGSGVVATIVGSAGSSGFIDGQGSGIKLRGPWGLCLDAGGILYVADAGNYSIRKIPPAQNSSCIVGFPKFGTIDAIGVSSRFGIPYGMAIDAGGNVYVADNNRHVVRKYATSNGQVSTLAGLDGAPGYVDGNGSSARLNAPIGLAVDTSGNIYVADNGNHAIRKITPSGSVTTLIDRTTGQSRGMGSNGQYFDPQWLAVNSTGTVWVTDHMDGVVWKVSSSGTPALLAGSRSTQLTSKDGTGTSAGFIATKGICLDGSSNAYVCDDSCIRKITSGGSVTTIAGDKSIEGTADGTGSAARFRAPQGIALDASGNLYVCDGRWSHTVRQITPSNVVTTIAGQATVSGYADGTGAVVLFASPEGVCVDSSGHLYVADSNNSSIRKTDIAAPVLTSVATVSGGLENAASVISHASILQQTSWSDVDTLAVKFQIQAVSSGSLAIRPAGTTLPSIAVTPGVTLLDPYSELVWTPPANTSGTISAFSVKLWDGIFGSSTAATVPVAVTFVNQRPTFTGAGNQACNEDAGQVTAPAWATNMNPGANEASQHLNFVIQYNSNPSLFGVAPAIDASTGNLTYTPAVNANGSAQVKVALHDDGGTLNGGIDTSTSLTFTITVNPVNDAPTFMVANPNQMCNEDAGAQTIMGWASGISAGPTNETGQTLVFQTTSVSNPGLFSVQPQVDAATGNLTYTPAPNMNGSSSVTVSLKDNGGIANGGIDTSAPVTFTISVNAVNDAPTYTPGGNQTVRQDQALQTVPWATNIVVGPNDELSQTRSFACSGYDGTLFSQAPGIDTNGILTYRTAAGKTGSTSVQVVLTDSGGTANGGVNAAAPVNFAITITADQAPTITSIANQTVAPNTTVGPLAFTIGDGDDPVASLTMTPAPHSSDQTIIPDANIALGGSGTTRNVSLTLLPNAQGTATITLNVSDGIKMTPMSFQVTALDPVWATLPPSTTYLEASETIYPSTTTNPNASDALTTTYAYTWFAGTQQVATKTVQLPTVATTTNGPGTATTLAETYDLVGRTVWSRDGEGFITYRAYDAYSGALVRVITDVDTTGQGTHASDYVGTPPWSTPTAPTVQVSGGLHLKADIQVDALGRPVKVTDPAGSVSYTVYQDAIRDSFNAPLPVEVRVYPGWDATRGLPAGPTQVTRDAWALSIRDVLAMSAVPQVMGGIPSGAEPIAGVEHLERITLDANSRVSTRDVYLRPSALPYTTNAMGMLTSGTDTDYERTTLTYDTRGHLIRQADPSGTIHRTVVDFLGRPTSRFQGTGDGGATATWSDASGDTPTFVKIETLWYDGATTSAIPGLSLLTKDVIQGDAGTLITTLAYDDFARLVASCGPDGVETFLTLDNLGRATTTERYAGVSAAGTVAPASASRRSRTVVSYDAVGQAWRSDAYAVTPAGTGSGFVGNLLRTDRWFDRRGLLLQATTGSAGAVSKARYDGAGRAVYTWTGAATNLAGGWSAARVSSNDILAQATGTIFDASGAAVCTTVYQCPDVVAGSTWSTKGDLTALNGLMDVTATWFDLGHRPTAVVSYGRDNGTTRYVWKSDGTLNAGANPALPAVVQGAVPTRGNPDYRVTTFAYDGQGLRSQVTDNLSHTTLTGYDGAGRVAKTVRNYVAGTPPASYADTDQLIAYARLPGGRVQTQHVWLTASSDEQTVYAYTSAIDAGWVASTTYPDGQAVSSLYDRLGRMTQQTDQRGVVHQYVYDAAGRLQIDKATTIPAAVSNAVQRIERAYDDLGRIQTISSFATLVATTAIDQVATTYDAWGHAINSQQEHGGPATGASLAVSTTWDDGAVGGIARSLHQTATTYPAGGVTVGYAYPTSADALGYALDRVSAITSGSSHLAEYDYLGLGAIARVRLPTAGAAVMDRSSPVGGANGYDRFWAISRHVWTGTSVSDGMTYIRDGGGRVLARVAAWGTSRPERDDVATYDNLDRLTGFHRGVSSGTGTIAAGATTCDWSWALDPAGNWRTYTVDSDGGAGASASASQTRLYNAANAIQDPSNPANPSITGTGGVFGSGWSQPAYDAAGFMTTAPKPGQEGTPHTLTWDAWGRLVQVSGSDLASPWVARYDGRHRLIRWTVGATVRDAYYTEADQEVMVCNGTAPSKAYTWGLGTDQLIRYQRDSTGGGTLNEAHGVLVGDLSSVTALVSESTGAIEERFRYDAYGVQTVLNAAGSTVAEAYGPRYGYTGRPVEATTGLAYFRARWYQAGLGRFISRDPAGYVDGGSLYQYVRGDPLGLADQIGLGPSLLDALTQGGAYVDQVLQDTAIGLVNLAGEIGSHMSGPGGMPVDCMSGGDFSGSPFVGQCGPPQSIPFTPIPSPQWASGAYLKNDPTEDWSKATIQGGVNGILGALPMLGAPGNSGRLVALDTDAVVKWEQTLKVLQPGDRLVVNPNVVTELQAALGWNNPLAAFAQRGIAVVPSTPGATVPATFLRQILDAHGVAPGNLGDALNISEAGAIGADLYVTGDATAVRALTGSDTAGVVTLPASGGTKVPVQVVK